MSDDTANWLSFFALAMSSIGIAVSLLARRDSNRSAGASEKSAEAAVRSATEAEKTSALTRVNLLAEHFLRVDFIFDAAAGGVFGKTREASENAKQSIRFLKNIIKNPDFHAIVDEIIVLFDKRGVLVFTAINNGAGLNELREQEARVAQIRKSYDVIKYDCLNINIG